MRARNFLAAVFGLALVGAKSNKAEDPEVKYALGRNEAGTLARFGLNAEEQAMVLLGFDDAMAGRSRVANSFSKRTDAVMNKIAARHNDLILRREKTKAGAIVLMNGTIYTELVTGKGASPAATDTVGIRFSGKLLDGTEFESTYKRAGSPIAEFRLDRVVPCFSEGIRRMKAGGKSKFICGPDIAFGDFGVGVRVPPMEVVSFEVELVDSRPTPPGELNAPPSANPLRAPVAR